MLSGSGVLVAGLFSAKQKDYAETMSVLVGEVERLGGRVMGQFVQRRGVSGGKKGHAPGGRTNMDRPYSSRTLMSTGKVREIAAVRVETDAKAVVFANELTTRQRTVLAELLGCPVLSYGDLANGRANDGGR
ncbi:hypothetical protein [Actinomadura sp. NEAU-AAG7]|uniref:HflX-like GTP-binding protein n=1 Tax=Actinomadura sp. NEAU-AAG7 TaxID=2839640 RepID=UPI0027E0121A|nr:hypothetical protein [Actinomadura sp. NEAU-AAG7]